MAVAIWILASRMSGSMHGRYLDAGPPLTGCVALGRSPLFPRSCSVVPWKIRRWMTCLGRCIPAATGCSSLGFLRLRAVSQTTLQSVPSHFRISSCSVVAWLRLWGSFTLPHCPRLLGARPCGLRLQAEKRQNSL